jgi:hypothetical protein
MRPVSISLSQEPGKSVPAVNRMHDVGNYCSDRGDGAAEGEEM